MLKIQKNSQNQILECAKIILANNGEQTEISLETIDIGFVKVHFLTFASVQSTMLLSKKWPRQSVEKNHCFIFRAKSQTKGQGQHSNNWQNGQNNLFMTILMVVDVQFINCMLAQIMLDIVESILLIGIEVSIKWVNDIIIDDHKIAGVLLRNSLEGKTMFSQIGIGINIYSIPCQKSTSLKQVKPNFNQSTSTYARQLAMSIIKHLKKVQIASHNIWQRYKKYLLYLNQYVYIYNSDKTKIIRQGLFTDINQNGFVIINKDYFSPIVDGRMMKYLIVQVSQVIQQM